MSTSDGKGFRLPQAIVTAIREIALQALVDTGVIAIDAYGNITSGALGPDAAYDPTTYNNTQPYSTIGSILQQAYNAIQDVSVDTTGLTLNSSTPGALIFGLKQNLTTSGTPTFSKVTTDRLQIQGSDAPTFVLGTGAGTGATGQITGSSDSFFRFDLTVGTSPAAGSANIASFTFSPAWGAAPKVLMLPILKKTFGLQNSANNAVFVADAGVGVNGFILTGGVNALTAGDAHAWYFVNLGS
ncbi:MAG TPA: hypothetical protein V6C65_10010 [Allocoleopsis sp.]